MSKKLIEYGKTPQFRDVIHNVVRSTRFVELDKDGEPVYDETKTLPTITFKGTIKLHGTNLGICYNDKEGIYYQSRNGIKSNGHFGSVDYLKLHEEEIIKLFKLIAKEKDIDTSKQTITVYAEYAGEGIQTGVAISELPKMPYIFAVKISPCCNGSQFEPYYLKDISFIPPTSVYRNIFYYKTFKIDIDFNNPGLSSELIEKYTLEVEDECPVAKAYDKEGIGEGIVWIGFHQGNRYIFKSKGEKHNNGKRSKKQSVAPIDPDMLKSVNEAVNKYVTDSRIKQAVQEQEIDWNRRHTGNVINWVKNDIMREEHLSLKENKIDTGLFVKELSTKIRAEFFKKIDEQATV